MSEVRLRHEKMLLAVFLDEVGLALVHGLKASTIRSIASACRVGRAAAV